MRKPKNDNAIDEMVYGLSVPCNMPKNQQEQAKIIEMENEIERWITETGFKLMYRAKIQD